MLADGSLDVLILQQLRGTSWNNIALIARMPLWQRNEDTPDEPYAVALLLGKAWMQF